ncbi:MAG: hypothetical protein NW217_06550 [Hyphomicrobiaceae bacterium]|nr:hypothetical protein [Hyphomicrobiaceae bacterium]
MGRLFALCAALLAMLGPAHSREATSFTASDGVTIHADVYKAVPAGNAPRIVLAHQAGSSRGEYREIAPRLHLGEPASWR